MGQRKQGLLDWLETILDHQPFRIEPASNDASFRRYFRVYVADRTWVVMDAPPDKEDCVPFLRIARALTAHGVHAPDIIAENLEQGYLLLSDLGSEWYLDALTGPSADGLYGDAFAALSLMQGIDCNALLLPAYDAALLRREMDLFTEWYLPQLLQVPVEFESDEVWSALIDAALEQPRVFVHRDYHSRNLMVVPDRNPGVIDFQDAVCGPITYDLVSLLRDCYIDWPDERVYAWVAQVRQSLQAQGQLLDCSETTFRRWFDLMGVQRQLKAIGIFARLYLRDGKPGYLKDIPRTLNYILQLGDRYPEIRDLQTYLKQQRIAERMQDYLKHMTAAESVS